MVVRTPTIRTLFGKGDTVMKSLPTTTLALFMFAGTATGQTIDWINPAGGSWNVPANWSTGAVPAGTTETASFNLGGSYTTIFNINSPNLGSLTILDPMCTLSMNSGNHLGVENGITNDGLILINNSNGGFQSSITFNNSAALTGTGTATLNGSGSRSALRAAAGQTITHAPNHTINGMGQLIGDFINNGTARSTIAGQTLDLTAGTWTNNNLIEVTNASNMDFDALTINQGPSGEVSVVDGQLNLINAHISGGTLRTMPAFNWIVTVGTSSLDSVNTIGNGNVNSSNLLQVINGIENDGVINVNPTNGGFQATIEFQSNAMLTGTGSIVMSGSGNRAVLRTLDPAEPATQGPSHTIHGMGNISGAITNNGSIISDVPGNTLFFNTDNQVNNNLYRVANASTMELNGVSVDQSGGGQIHLLDGTLSLKNATIVGGSITPGAGSALVNSGTSNFDQVQVSAPISINTGNTMTVTNGIVNDSIITINHTNGGFATFLRFNDSTTLSGTGHTVLGGSGNRAHLSTDAGQTLTIGSSQTVRGLGEINASLINNGTIDADVSGQTLFLLTEDKTNNALISVQPGASMLIGSVSITQSPGAQIDAGDGSISLSNATIIGGSITSGSGAVTQTSGTSTLDQVTNTGQLNLHTGSTLAVVNGLENNATLSINPGNGGFATSLLFNDSSTLSGSGDTVLDGSASRAQINSAPGQTPTIGPAQTVRGFGQIHASLINEGLISADNSQKLDLLTNNKINNGLFQVSPASNMSITGIEIDQTGGGQMLANDGVLALSGTTIKGGTLDTLLAGSILATGNSTYQNLVNLATTNINTGVALEIVGTVTNHGTISINYQNGGFATSLTTTTPATIDGIGDVILAGSTSRSQITGVGITLGAGQTLRGYGQVNGPLTLHGTLAPGFSVGEIEASAPITLSNTSTYEVEVSGPTTHDTIDSSSTFHADGTLDLSLLDGFVPTTAFVATIVTADAGVTGTFDTLVAPPPPLDPRLTYKIGYFDTEIRVGAVCDSDVDFNGELDFFDVSLFLSLFAQQDPSVDYNNDSQFDFFDVSLFLSTFGAGCP